jgi:hypothetical protein
LSTPSTSAFAVVAFVTGSLSPPMRVQTFLDPFTGDG